MSEEPAGMESIDRMIHSPARLSILRVLSVVEAADFTFLLNQTGLTRGNLSANLGKLEEAEYLGIEKSFVGRKPRTVIRLTGEGREAMAAYAASMRQVLDALDPR